jgi:hypothetical protein
VWLSPTGSLQEQANPQVANLRYSRQNCLRYGVAFEISKKEDLGDSLCAPHSQTCCGADFETGRANKWEGSAGLETHDTADLEVCATGSLAGSRQAQANPQVANLRAEARPAKQRKLSALQPHEFTFVAVTLALALAEGGRRQARCLSYRRSCGDSGDCGSCGPGFGHGQRIGSKSASFGDSGN